MDIGEPIAKPPKSIRFLLNVLMADGSQPVINFLAQVAENVPECEIDEDTFDKMFKLLKPIVDHVAFCHMTNYPESLAVVSVVGYINSIVGKTAAASV